MKPPPTLTISEWADEFRYLSPEASAEPGKWHTDRAEYQREIMDCIGDPTITRVVVIKGAQVGWTEIINNAAGFYIDQDPAPILVIQPSIEMTEAWSKDRLAPMLRDAPTLKGKVRDPRSRDSGNTLRQKLFPGGHLSMIGANAPAALASRPIRVVLADEVDRYPASAGTEGDPLSLAAKRQLTFWNRKTLIGSTPTVKGFSAIEREWNNSDKRRFHVPCPHCEHPQPLKWSQVRWDKNEGEAEKHRPETAHYVCEECGALWNDAERWDAIKLGAWVSEATSHGVAGFHIPGFLSPWLTLEEIVRDFLKSKNDPQLLQVWVNTVLGEPWEEDSERVEAGGLLGRAEVYDSDTLPMTVHALTAGIDVQDNRLEVQVVGWGAKEEAWPVRYEVLHGDPAQPKVWEDLDALLLEKHHREDGSSLRIRAACIDTGGHHGERVYAFVKTRRSRKVFAAKGASGARPIWPKRASRAGAKGRDEVFIVGVDTAKDAIYGRLRIQTPGPGFVHFPVDDGFDKTYFEQLTSEQVVTRYKEGRPYRVWVLGKGKRNEALDTFVLALAAMKALPLRLDRLAPGALAETTPEQPASSVPNVPEVKMPEPRVAVPQQTSSWLDTSGRDWL